MIDARRPVRVGIEGAAQLCSVIVSGQCSCAGLLVRQWPKQFLNLLRDGIDPIRRNAAVRKVLAVVWIANRDTGKAPAAPDFQRDGRIYEIEDVAPPRRFE